jgi:predicted nucleic acid-binding protein
MIVVSDTSPLTALITVGEADLLPKLFNEVVIPEAVRDELLRSHPSLPAWLRVETVRNSAEARRMASVVDAGEAEAIELAKELHADRLLIDERKGRRLAIQEGVPVIGLLGALLLAKRRGLIPSARALLQRLENEAGMYLSEAIKDEAFKSVGE